MDPMELYGELTVPGGAAFPILQVGKQGLGVLPEAS